ncbi:phosphate ABC transporter permease PstA [Solimonas sp. SE-A11]|uniref:phosphate ABC transporter permease PstA n=1 Tax=Solimonas sp. SE-A11 TaxID=3054954 RepID=UPI00259CA759|nr:phosphate ABC transporter permease PstA [Solimonas sp. SE-A11]MDM4770066.1 phosphate ABC transporter permease PstA [Solimonas sp. SE-A11]
MDAFVQDTKLYARRKRRNAIAMVLSYIAAGSGFVALLWILGTLVSKGIGGLSFETFTAMTPPPGESGGLLNAIYGSAIQTLVAALVGTPIGILAGTFMAEYGRGTKTATIVRFINDVLLSAPSIVIGLFVYELMVRPMGHFSAWAGSVALAILVIPVVVRTTEDMLLLVPNTLREAASSLGASRWRVINKVCYRAALSGLVTGALLAVARISGETAPLLFTSLNNQFWSTDMNQPMANLPVVIFQFAMSPYQDWQKLAWVGALIITTTVLALNILARSLSSPRGQQS